MLGILLGQYLGRHDTASQIRGMLSHMSVPSNKLTYTLSLIENRYVDSVSMDSLAEHVIPLLVRDGGSGHVIFVSCQDDAQGNPVIKLEPGKGRESMAVLEVKDVGYYYFSDKPVLKGINLSFEKGKFYAICGPSGCGKTTLLSLMGGLDEPKSGEILYEGQNIMEKGKGLAWHRKNNVAFVFQNYNLIEYMTPKENVLLTAKEDPMPVLESLGITKEEAGRNVLKLSGGQQQRVAIARALASHAPVILADEPTGNLDEDTAAEITQILKSNAHEQGRCVIVVTHSDAVA